MTQALSVLIALSALALMGSIGVLVTLLILKTIKSFMKKDTIKLKRPIMIASIAAPCSLFVIIISIIVGQATNPTAWCDHEYTVLEQQDANCTNSGYIKKLCSLCNNEITETIEPYHLWIEDGVTEATCTSQKQIRKKCTRCETTEYEKVGGLLNHSWIEDSVIEATCSHPKQLINKCSMCGTTEIVNEGPTIPHSFDDWIVNIESTTEKEGKQTRKCTVCDYSENAVILKKSPIAFIKRTYEMDYVGGVQWTFEIKNNSKKEIKYVTLEWSCCDSVGEPIYDDITGKNLVGYKFPGPWDSGETKRYQTPNTSKFYNHAYAQSKLVTIKVEFMDGEIVDINSKEYTDIFKTTSLNVPTLPYMVNKDTDQPCCTITKIEYEFFDYTTYHTDGKFITNDFEISIYGEYNEGFNQNQYQLVCEMINSKGEIILTFAVDFDYLGRYHKRFLDSIDPGETYTLRFYYTSK